MSDTSRNLNSYLNLNTSNFNKGVNEAKAKLAELNTALLQNKREQKNLQEQIKNLTKLQKSNKQSTDEEKAKYAELNEQIDEATLKLSELKTEEQMLKTQVKNANKELEAQTNTTEKVTKAQQNLSKALKTAAQFTGTAVAGMFTYAASAAASADNINTLAKQTGLTTDEIQKLMYAEQLIDVETETITGAMSKLVKNMASAKEGSGAAYDAFTALGVSITDSTGALRSNQDVFDEVIEKLGKIENETQRDAYAMSIFGKSAQDLNPLILGGTEQLKAFGDELEREGLILNQNELDRLNEFNDKIDTFLAKLQAGLFASSSEAVDAFDEIFEMSDDVIELITDLVTALAKATGFIVEHKDVVLALVAAYGSYKAVMSIGTLISSVVTVTKSLTTATQGATVAQQGMNAACNANPYVMLASALAALVGGIVTYSKLSKNAASAVDDLNESVEKSVSEAKAEAELLKEQGDRYESLRTKINKTAEEERELYNIAADLEGKYPGQIELIGDTADAYKELGEQAEIAGQKLINEATAQAQYNALVEAYTKKEQLEFDISEKESEMENYKGEVNWYDFIIGQNTLVDYIVKSNKELKPMYDELAELESYIKSLESQLDGVQYGSKESSDDLIALEEATKAVTAAEEEFANTNKLSEETLNAITAAYPELQDEVNDYINNVGTAEDVINHLNIAYQNDVANNKEALQAKLNTDTEYYKELQKMNDSAINKLANKYGLDLSNYESYAEAKLAIEREFLTQKADYWEKYYSLEEGRMKVNLKDITTEQLRLVNEEGYTPEQAMAATKQMQNEYTYVYSELLPGLHDLRNSLETDITEYSKWYTPQLTNTTTNDTNTTSGGSSSSGSTAAEKEISIYELANEAFKQLTEERIEEIKRLTEAENDAADERIAAINAEIEAREKLKDASDMQEQIDFLESQLKYSKLEDFERQELERQLADLKEEQSDQAWLDSKNAEIAAIESEKTAREAETAELVEKLNANQAAASTWFTDQKNGYQSVSSVINNNSRQANINIIAEAYSLGQITKAVADSLGLELIT